jgi:hypothetical protein
MSNSPPLLTSQGLLDIPIGCVALSNAPMSSAGRVVRRKTRRTLLPRYAMETRGVTNRNEERLYLEAEFWERLLRH